MVQSAQYDTALALSRFGLGAGADGIDAVSGDVRAALHDEIHHGALRVTSRDHLPPTHELLKEMLDLINLEHRQAAALQANPNLPLPVNDNVVATRSKAEIDARYNGTCMRPAIGFNERMTMFWANHFAVATAKSRTVRIMTGAYEREAIRPNIFGRFTDLVLAVETHPCMLTFLDNTSSIGPESRDSAVTPHGINENLAREIMELHVLGVGSGYSQADVTSFANALTGWTVNHHENDPHMPYGDFTFIEGNHQPGSQVVLGKTYHNYGFFQAANVLTDLCHRPAAAQFICTKLARHFIADDPPQSLVDRLAQTFMATDGNLAEVSHTLIDSDEAWAPQTVKIRSPQEWLVAMMRAGNINLQPGTITNDLVMMGQPQWNPGGPNGFSDQVAAWATPEGLTARMAIAGTVADLAPADTDPRAFADRILGARLSDTTRAAVAHAESMTEGLSLVFLSPEFLRR